ncbi:MAG: hypothetical protein R3E64_08495 [Halioglobus sp.]
MRNYFYLLSFMAILGAGSAAACDIEDKQEIQVGASEGIAGKCSNNSAPVQCISDASGADRFSCDGIEGTFNGPNLKQLIAAACGCGANSDDSASEQLNQELNGL